MHQSYIRENTEDQMVSEMRDATCWESSASGRDGWYRT